MNRPKWTLDPLQSFLEVHLNLSLKLLLIFLALTVNSITGPHSIHFGREGKMIACDVTCEQTLNP